MNCPTFSASSHLIAFVRTFLYQTLLYQSVRCASALNTLRRRPKAQQHRTHHLVVGMLAVISYIVAAPYSVSALQFKHLHPQTIAIRDSLLTTLQRYDAEQRSDTGVVRCLNGLAWQYWQSRPHVALGYAERALNMAQKLGDRLGEANAQMRLGSIFRRLNDKDRSVAAYTACIQQARTLGDSDLVGLALNGMALMFQKRGQPEAALRLHLQHIRLRESIKDTVSQFAPFLNIGELYASQHQYGLALEYLHKGVDVLATRPPTAGLSTLYSTISRVHLAQKHYAVAIEHARKAQQVAAQVNDLESMVSVMETMGNIYAAQGSLNLALEQYSHALQSLRDRGYDNDRPSLLCAMGDVYLQQGKVQKALEFAERAVKASEHALWTDRERSLELLSQAYTLAGRRTEALQAFEHAQQIHDSVLTNDNRVQMAELETQFSKERQRLVIQRLEGDEKRQQLLVYAFGAISFLLLVWSVTALVMVRWQRRNRTQLQQREALLKQVQSLGKMAGFEWDVLTNRLTITEEMFLIVERKSNTATYTIEDFFSRIHAGDEIRVRQAFQEAQNTDKRLFAECRAITPDGRTKFLAVGGTVERDQSGHPVRMIGFVQDVTENAIAKNVLVTTRTMLAGVMSSSLDGIMTFVSLRNENKEINDFQCTMANPVAERSLGAAADGLIARRLRDTIDENPLSGLFPQCVKVVSTGVPERFEYAWKYAGVHCWMQVVIVKLGDGFVLTFSDITSRKHAEESLRVSEQKLKALFNSTSEMFFLIGTQHELLAYNNAAAHSLRMTAGREPFIGDSLLHYFRHDAARDAFQAHHQEALNGSIRETEDLYIGPSGAAEWHLIRYLPVYNDTGTVFAVSLILLNIHARKQAEERIRESEEQLRRVQRIGKIAGMTLNIETLEMEWTEEFYTIVERSPEELPKMLASLEMCVHPADVVFVRNTLIQAMRNNRSDETLEYRIITPSGKVKFVVTELTIVYNHITQRAVEMVGFVQDITERKRVEKEQRQSEHLYRQLVEASPDAIAVIDTEGRFVSANQRQATMLGFRSPQELIGRLEAEFVESENLPEFARHRMNAPSEMIDDQTTIVNLEVVFVRKDGRRITAENSLVMLRGDRNEPAGTLVISRDITERKEFEEELKKAKADAEAANKLKSEFVANISHEIRTPMNAIIGFSELLREQVQDFMLDSYVQGINTAASTLLMLINDVLDISKIEAGRLDIYYEPVQPFKILVEMQQTFFAKTREKGIEFVIDVADDFPETILLDEIRLRQILLNLLSNAVKFTDIGSVSLILRATPALSANTAAPLGEHRLMDLSFAVRDTGIGIPAEQQETVFEAFRQQEGQNTRRYGGTGLGLTISRRLAEMMGGRIEVESGVGMGSVFTLHLPSVFVVENRADYDALANKALQLSQTTSGANVRSYTPLVDAAASHEFFAGTYQPLTDTSTGKYIGQYSSMEATGVSSANAVAVPTVLAESLQGALMDEWRSIGEIMNNLDIEHFAERVRSLGKEYGVVNLANYGDDLYRKTVAFKIVEMNTAFKQFPRVVEELLDSVQPNE